MTKKQLLQLIESLDGNQELQFAIFEPDTGEEVIATKVAIIDNKIQVEF